jgi:hypothetical protein
LRTARSWRSVRCQRQQGQIISGNTEQVPFRAAHYIPANEQLHCSGECEALLLCLLGLWVWGRRSCVIDKSARVRW